MQKLIMLRGTHTQNTRRSVSQAGAAAVSAVVSKTKKSTTCRQSPKEEQELTGMKQNIEKT